MTRKFTKYPTNYVRANDYSEYYGNIAVSDYIRDSELVQYLVDCVESGSMNGYDEWGAVNFLAGHFGDTKVNLHEIDEAITEVWYNRPEIQNFDKLVRLGV